MVLFNNPIDRQQVAALARRIYPSTSAIFMKRFEQATSHPYGYLVIDLKSGTLEKDRQHTEIFEKVNLTDEKMFVDEGNVDDADDKPMIKSDLPPGRPEHKELTDHTTNRATQKDCILRELVIHKVERIVSPQLDDDTKEHYPDCDPKLAKRERLKKMLPEIRKMTREYLRDQLVSIYHLERCPLYTAERLHRSSHLSVPLAIT